MGKDKPVSKETLIEQAINYIGGDEAVWKKDLAEFGDPKDPSRLLRVLSKSEECIRAKTVKAVLEDYVTRPKGRPFCLAVFGPPGSGKSTLVKAILASMSNHYAPSVDINLSQLMKREDLIINFDPEGKIPVIFFDEFDAAVEGIPLGWLSVLLSLMQDGKIKTCAGEKVLKKAVLVFAGGTADTLSQFEEDARKNLSEYKSRKVPDFISRLHAYINVAGINGEDRIKRRALALKYQLAQRGIKEAELTEGFATMLLDSSHFIHNQRSFQTVIDLSRITGDNFDISNLPGDGNAGEQRALLHTHVSRGPLDNAVVGVSTWQNDETLHGLAEGLAQSILELGGTLAFGGDMESRGILPKLIDLVDEISDGLVKRTHTPIRNYLAYPANLRPEVAKQITAVKSKPNPPIKFIEMRTLSKDELADLNCPPDSHFYGRPLNQDPYNPDLHCAWAISLFRMRLRMIRDLDALIVFGGKSDDSSWGRSSGIAEEVMLAQSLKKPVYIVAKDAADEVGQLLNLGPRGSDDIMRFQYKEEFAENLEQYRSSFSFLSSINGLGGQLDKPPLTSLEINDVIRQFAIGGPHWVDNGLSLSQNIELFERNPSEVKEIVETIIHGLKRVISPKLSS